MPVDDITAGAVWQGVSQWLMKHTVIDVSGTTTDLEQTHVESITVKVYEDGVQIDDTGAPVADGDTFVETLDASDTVFDTPQDDDRWGEADDVGYTFAFLLSGSYLPHGNQVYRIEADIEVTGGEVFPQVWVLTTKNRLRH